MTFRLVAGNNFTQHKTWLNVINRKGKKKRTKKLTKAYSSHAYIHTHTLAFGCEEKRIFLPFPELAFPHLLRCRRHRHRLRCCYCFFLTTFTTENLRFVQVELIVEKCQRFPLHVYNCYYLPDFRSFFLVWGWNGERERERGGV